MKQKKNKIKEGIIKVYLYFLTGVMMMLNFFLAAFFMHVAIEAESIKGFFYFFTLILFCDMLLWVTLFTKVINGKWREVW